MSDGVGICERMTEGSPWKRTLGKDLTDAEGEPVNVGGRTFQTKRHVQRPEEEVCLGNSKEQG